MRRGGPRSLQVTPRKHKLKLREHPKLGVYVDGLCELVCRKEADVYKLIDQGNSVRARRAT